MNQNLLPKLFLLDNICHNYMHDLSPAGFGLIQNIHWPKRGSIETLKKSDLDSSFTNA